MGRAWASEYVKYWSWDWLGWVPGIALPSTHPAPYPGYTSPYPATAVHGPGMQLAAKYMVVGLKSVDQLT